MPGRTRPSGSAGRAHHVHVYSDRYSIDRFVPFEVLPRVLSAEGWQIIETDVQQPVQALDLSCTISSTS